ncbi:hypothetical protein U9882_23215 [Escherichia coli]
MFLIMSAAYVDQELSSEFGLIPPSLLPLGNRRLFQHQLTNIPSGVEAFLSLPESYKIRDIDEKWLTENSINILRIPDGLSLGASLVAALNLTEKPLNSPLHVLFGDTLINPLPTGDDIVAVSDIENIYNWAFVTNDDRYWLEDSQTKNNVDSNNVVSGYFKFSEPRQLIKAITQSHWNFIEGLNKYHKNIGLTSVKVENWLDFGHINTYYRSKATHTTQRAFNELLITPNWIEKSSEKSQKIKAEANWFEQLPNIMRGYTPQFLGANDVDGRFSYKLEYLHHTALNELYVFSELPMMIWNRILDSCLDFIDSCLSHNAEVGVPCNKLDELFGVKTAQRLDEFCKTNSISPTQKWKYNGSLEISLTDLINESSCYLPENGKLSILHGDFCFSNILYDFRTTRIKTIDPRGVTPNGELSIFGDVQYDIAKLSHSILGMYDWIIAGYFDITIDNQNIEFDLGGLKQHKGTQQSFIELIEARYGLNALNLYAMQIQLFISMLPLHADHPKRQMALMANAFRIFQLLKRFEK